MSLNASLEHHQAPAHHDIKSGFTLVEVLVSLGVIIILIALLLPSLGQVRLTATELSCTTRIRELGNLVVNYAAEYDDKFPSALGDGPEITQSREMWPHYSFQLYSTFPRDPWLQCPGSGPSARFLTALTTSRGRTDRTGNPILITSSPPPRSRK